MKSSSYGTKNEVGRGCGLASLGNDRFVGHFIGTTADNIAGNKGGIPDRVDTDVVTHLTKDHFEVLIMNTNALTFP